MAGKKKILASLRYIVPTEMEYFLEERASEGMHLCPLGEMGFFYFDFVESEPEKVKYVVDVTALPKALYMQTLIEKEWQYLGKTGNCYVWRKPYDSTRPEEFADKSCRKKYCKRMGIGFFLTMLFFLAAMILLGYGAYFEISHGVMRYYLSYIIEALFLIPFAGYCGWAARKLWKAGKD